jgi:signal transduction histidine kinase
MRRIIAYVPYASLAFSALLVLALDRSPAAALPLTAALVVGAAAWMLWWVTLHPRWAERRPLMIVYYLGLLAFIAVLVALDPLFGFFAFTGYLHAAYALWGRWRLVGVGAVAVFSALSQVGGLPTLRTAGGVVLYLVVLLYNAAVAGALTYLAWRQEFTLDKLAESNRRLEDALAENAGLHAQLLAQAREAGVLDERQRIAHEIHDTIAQGLAGIVTQLEAASSTVTSRHVSTAAQLARDSLTTARRSVHALRPQELEDARLPEALAGVVERWSAVTGVPAALTTTGDAQPLLPEIEVALLRIAQEALANVAKHAGAGRAGLTLSYMEDLVTLDIRDDGTGFAPSTVERGFGLSTMRERVQRIGGRLAVESEPGRGTAVSASVPALVAGGLG